MRTGIAPLLCVLLVTLVDGRSVHRFDKVTGDFQFVVRRHLDPFSIVEEVPVYSSAEDEATFSLDPRSSDLICNTCCELSMEAEKVLDDPDFSDKIEMISAQVCQILPPDLESKCAETLEMYLEDIMSYLQNIFDKENLCYGTGLCAENAKSSSPSSGISKLEAVSLPEFSLWGSFLEVSGTKACIACRNATDAILKALEDPETKIKIIRILLKACQQVEDHAQQCKKLVFEYGPIALSRVEKYLQSNDLCALAEFCQDFVDFPTPEED